MKIKGLTFVVMEYTRTSRLAMKNVKGVYAIFIKEPRKRKIMYIGRTAQLKNRMSNHRYYISILENRIQAGQQINIAFLEKDNWLDRKQIERSLIKKIKPPGNLHLFTKDI